MQAQDISNPVVNNMNKRFLSKTKDREVWKLWMFCRNKINASGHLNQSVKEVELVTGSVRVWSWVVAVEQRACQQRLIGERVGATRREPQQQKKEKKEKKELKPLFKIGILLLPGVDRWTNKTKKEGFFPSTHLRRASCARKLPRYCMARMASPVCGRMLKKEKKRINK